MHRFLALVLLTASIGSLHLVASQPPPIALFVERPGAVIADLAQAAETMRARATGIEPEALTQDVLDLALFENTLLRAVLDHRTTSADGTTVWSGRVEGDATSTVTFVRRGDLVQGSISTMDGAYSIEPANGSSVYTIRQVDVSRLGPELPPLRLQTAPQEALNADDVAMAGDDGSTFDLLVAYTPAAVTAAGSLDALSARIALGVAETNTAYANSGVTPRLRLVGTQQVTYSESGDLGADLNAFTSTGDNQMDSIHALRNAVGADLVTLVVGNAAGGACGVAWLMESLASSFAAHAFSVIAYPCISPNYTFGHELGHNMGSNHAPDDPVSPTPLYPYSFGYKHPANLFRTVMAYACATNCPRVLYFSNPSVDYGGAPTGTVVLHNNALSINNARTTIANWRQQATTNTPPTLSTPGPQTIAEDTLAAGLAITVGDAQTPATGLVVTARSSNISLVPNTAAALTLSGSGATRILTVTPQPNANGSTAITVSVSDGSLTTSSTFVLTVTAVNDAPAVSTIGAQTINEDQSISVSFTVADAETAAGALSVQASSSNLSLVGATGMVLSGSGGTRMLTLSPVANQWGVATITVAVSDGVALTPRTFALTVVSVNDAPVLSGVPPLVSTTTGVPTTFAVTVSDADTLGLSLALTATSSNSTLLPAGGIAIGAQSATASSRTFLVTLTPAPGQTGSGGLTLNASDAIAVVTTPVSFTVTAVATAPDAPSAASAIAVGTAVTFSWMPALTGSAPSRFVVELGTAPGTTTISTQSVMWPGTALALTLPAGTYYARVRAVNSVGQSAPSPEATVTVVEPSPIPGPPGNFSATTVGTTLHFTWTTSTIGAAATRFVIEAGSAPGLANLAVLDTATAATSWTVPNVPVGTYWIRVRGANSAGAGAPSQDVSVVMGTSAGCVGLPSAPVLLTPVVSGLNVSLSWTAPAGRPPTGYVIAAGSAAGLSNLANFGTGNTATSFAASAPAGLYFVRVAASNGCGVGPTSPDVSFTLGMDVPGAPTDLSAIVGPGGLVTLAWNAPPSAVATSYLVEAGSDRGMLNLARLSTRDASSVFHAVAPAGTYFVRVRGVNGGGASAASNEVVVTVP